jgi:hypothetical protein
MFQREQYENGLKKIQIMSNLNKHIVPLVPLVHSTNSTNGTNEHRYILEKGSKKHHCPECDKKRFVRYIDTETGNYLPNQYGRCDRESKCSYKLNPYKDGYAKMIWEQEQGQYSGNLKPNKRNLKQYEKPKPVFIPVEVLHKTRSGYKKNVFIQNLLSRVAFPFKVQDIEKVISLYNMGTVQNGYRTGANTFPFIDIENNVRAIQVKQFDKTNHTTGTDFLHSIIEKHHTRNKEPLPEWLKAYNKNELKVSCLFGEHLLNKYPYNPVALVEAPKTAVYGTLYFGFPEQNENLLWLAVYNLSSLNLNKCQALKGRDVYLFPDLSKNGKAFDLWSNEAKAIQSHLKGTRFVVSGLLEQLATEPDKEKGNDLADYLIKQDWRLFRKHQKPESLQKSEINKLTNANIKILRNTKVQNLTKPNIDKLTNVNIEQPENWERDISELKTYFESIELPTKSIKLNQCSTVINLPLFIESHFATVKANNGKQTFLPYLNRLQELKKVLAVNSN